MPRKVFVAGEILTAADVNTNLMDQTVMTFAGTAARGSAIPSPTEGMVTYLNDSNGLEVYTTAWESIRPLTASTAITATNASWPVPSLASPIARVIVIGGGGGGGGASLTSGATAGGTTTFDAGGAGTVTAAGGLAGLSSGSSQTGIAGKNGFVSSNEGGGGSRGAISQFGTDGGGGAITVAYLNLAGISTANVTIGAGGNGAVGDPNGGAGGAGVVIVEYVAG